LKKKTSLLIDDFQKSKKSGWIKLLFWLQSFVCRKADVIIVPSEYISELVRGWGVPKEKIEVIDKKIEILPKVEQECPKCKNAHAYFWLLQTRSADEAETTFYKCTKCNYTWRTY